MDLLNSGRLRVVGTFYRTRLKTSLKQRGLPTGEFLLRSSRACPFGAPEGQEPETEFGPCGSSGLPERNQILIEAATILERPEFERSILQLLNSCNS
jgi:hypothetical protein